MGEKVDFINVGHHANAELHGPLLRIMPVWRVRLPFYKGPSWIARPCHDGIAPGCQQGHQRLKTLANRLNDRLTRLTTSRRSGAGEPEEGDMPGAVAHGPGRSPVAGPEAAQVGVASEAHRSIGRR